MTRRSPSVRLGAAVAVAMLIGAACGGGGEPTPGQTGQPGTRGGVLHVALMSDVTAAMDPAAEYYGIAWGLLRVMQRTLLTYKALPAPEGNELVPDIAAAMPEVSSDGLQWRYTLKPNVKFGPPVSRPVVCADVKAGFERMFGPAGEAGYTFYYTVIEGSEDFRDGKADEISGIQCENDQSLVFSLTEPAGDFPFRTAMPATAPVPAAENVSKGHDQDYGRLQVSTGPYMWLGMQDVDFSQAKPEYPPGYRPNRSMTLVRNPDWDAATDDVRNAYVDEIQVDIGGEQSDLENKVQSGDLDFIEDGTPSPQLITRYQTDPNLKPFMYVHQDDRTSYLWMNVKTPPFDDLHVRKAVNFVVNKDALRRARGGPITGTIATHVVPPTMAGALPASYDPYPSPGHRGDVNAAMAEMKLSKYDTDQDGKCDADNDACKVFWVTDVADPYPQQTASLQDDLSKIGIVPDGQVKQLDRATMYNFYSTIAKEVEFGSGAGWGKDYADALTFIDPLFNGESIQPTGNVNYSLVDDPTLNGKIDECKRLTGDARGACWAEADKYIMENIANWVPYLWVNNVRVFSTNIASTPIPWNQFAGGTAYDQIYLTQEAINRTKSEVSA